MTEILPPVLMFILAVLFWFQPWSKNPAPKPPRWSASDWRPTKPRQYIHDMTLAQMEAGNAKNAARLAEWLKETEEIHPIKDYVYPTASRPATPKTVPPASNRPTARRAD